MAKDWKKKTIVFHDFEKTKEVIGKLIKIEDSDYGKQLTLVKADQTQVLIASFPTLNDLISENDLNKELKIVFTETKVSKAGNDYKCFEVFQ